MSFNIVRNHTEKPDLCPSACLGLLVYDHLQKHLQRPSCTPPSSSDQGPDAEGRAGTDPARH